MLQLDLLRGAPARHQGPEGRLTIVGPSNPSAVVEYRTGRCSLGVALAAATEEGVCALLLGDDERGVLKELQESLPDGPLRPSDSASMRNEELDFVIRAIDAAPTELPELRLDLRGSDFQRRVWGALIGIPPGVTLTYGELTNWLGLPATAIRAVAGACAANPIAVLIPCHRVLAKDGGLTGYRWGLERKRALLEREGHPAEVQPDLWRDKNEIRGA